MDDAGLGECFDQGDLLLDRPAVAAGADGHDGEGDEWFGFVIVLFHEPCWNIGEGL